MTETPQTQAKVEADIFFDRLPDQNQGPKYISVEFKSMVNGGYIVRGTLADPRSGLLTQLINTGYLENSRTHALQMRFRIRSSVNDELATDFQIVNIVSLRAKGNSPDTCTLEFIGVDPPSWYLNTGDTAGDIYTGNVKSVIEQVIQKYAPNIEYEIGETLDSKQNKWAMMRQDPKSFILSLLEWSPSITQNKTHWITTVDGGKQFGDKPKIIIKEQAIIPSKSRAYYEYWGARTDTVKDWEFLSDNALSILETKMTTQGISSISGEYLDKITDNKEQKVFVKDSNTQNKKIASTDKKKSTTKPDDSIGSGPQKSGWSQVMAIPEFNAGDLGLSYSDYIDGRARGIYLNLVNSLMRMKLGVIGHHVWSSGYGLGTDTIFISWRKQPSSTSSDTIYFLSGNWIVYGFEHIATRKNWRTNLYVSRFDYNAEATKVGI